MMRRQENWLVSHRLHSQIPVEFEFNQRLSITLKFKNVKIYCVSSD